MENAGLYKELVENLDSIIIVTDPAFHIEYASPAVGKFNIDPKHLSGKSVFDFVSPDRVEHWQQWRRQGLASMVEEISFTDKEGNILYFEVHLTRLSDGRVRLHLYNVTDRKLREYELLRTNQQLDQVIYKTTHDLKAPLRSALGLINLAEKSGEDEVGKFMGMIRKSLMKLDGLIEEMNDFFRNDKLALRREKIDLQQLITDELEHLLATGGSNIRIDFAAEGELDFYSDGIRVQTIVTNILSNAIKYSDPKKSEPFIKINVSINEDFCELRIVDNGIGIDQKYVDKIFDLFFRATEQGQGTGLGLFIVKDTIQKLKGKIEVTSTLGQGTTFSISIPNQIYQPVLVD